MGTEYLAGSLTEAKSIICFGLELMLVDSIQDSGARNPRSNSHPLLHEHHKSKENV